MTASHYREYETYKDDIAYLIQIQGVYDGWSIAALKDGTYVNRWEPPGKRHDIIEESIARYEELERQEEDAA